MYDVPWYEESSRCFKFMELNKIQLLTDARLFKIPWFHWSNGTDFKNQNILYFILMRKCFKGKCTKLFRFQWFLWSLCAFGNLKINLRLIALSCFWRPLCRGQTNCFEHSKKNVFSQIFINNYHNNTALINL